MLVGADVFLQERVEVEEDEAMHANHPGHSPHHGQPGFKALIPTLLEPCQQLLCKLLHVTKALEACHQRTASMQLNISHGLQSPLPEDSCPHFIQGVASLDNICA